MSLASLNATFARQVHTAKEQHRFALLADQEHSTRNWVVQILSAQGVQQDRMQTLWDKLLVQSAGLDSPLCIRQQLALMRVFAPLVAMRLWMGLIVRNVQKV